MKCRNEEQTSPSKSGMQTMMTNRIDTEADYDEQIESSHNPQIEIDLARMSHETDREPRQGIR